MIGKIFLFLVWFLLSISPGIFLHNLISTKKRGFNVIYLPWYFSLGIGTTTILSFLLCLFHIFNVINIIIIIFVTNFILVYLCYTKTNKNNIDGFGNFLKQNASRFKNFFKKDNLVRIVRKKANFIAFLVIAIIILVLFIELLINIQFPQYDTWVYYHLALDILNYNIDLIKYFPEYVDNIVNSNYLIYYWVMLLSPFQYDLSFQNIILAIGFPIIQITVFIVLIYYITVKVFNIKPYLSLGIFLAGYHLNTWISFSLPSSLSLIILPLMAVELYQNKNRNFKLGIIFLSEIFLFHRTTFILAILGLLLYDWKSIIQISKSKIKTFFRNDQERKIFNFSSRNLKISLIIATALLILIITLIFRTPIAGFLNSIYNKLTSVFTINPFERYVIPQLDLWTEHLAGPVVLILSILFPFFYYKSPKKDTFHNKKLANFIYYFMIMFFPIILLLPYWNIVSFFPYLFYRYFIFIDLAMIFILPLSLKFLIQIIKKRIIDKKTQNKIVKGIQVVVIAQIAIFAGIHISTGYFYSYFNGFVTDEQIESYYWLIDNSDFDSIYMILPHEIARSRNMYSQSIFFNRYVVDYDESRFYFGSLLTQTDNVSAYLSELKDYLINGTKTLRLNGRTRSENLFEKDQQVHYLITESYYNSTVYEAMREDPFFKEIYFKQVVDMVNNNIKERGYLYYNLSIFEIIVMD